MTGNTAVQYASIGGVSQYFLRLALLIKGEPYSLAEQQQHK
jgi:hypothetical protein